jgi:hypothetical protein
MPLISAAADRRIARASEHGISGRYVGTHGNLKIELRVDVDGARPLNRVSADYFRHDCDDWVHTGSMSVDAPKITCSPSMIVIAGAIRSSAPTDTHVVKVAIPRVRARGQPASAWVSFVARNGRIQGRYACCYECESFRDVVLEEDKESGVECFESYDTGALPSPASPRSLTFIDAFRDAGIEMVRTREPGVIEAPPDSAWSDAELHAAMVQRFTAFADVPQWAIWLLHARRHEADRAGRGNLAGLMFDQRGRQRQGCALFYDGFGGVAGAERTRIQLLAAVHELAHGFNLLHSFEKSLAKPPIPSRPTSATWMAYPHRFPGGQDAFWSQFAFQFDDLECAHLRHAFRDDVIMGGNPFTAGAAFEEDAREQALRREQPGAVLRLSAATALPYGMPVTVDYELAGTTRTGRLAPSVLGPRARNLEFEIRGPTGITIGFEPLLRHCRLDDAVLLRAGGPSVRDSAFIHYGRNGFAFDQPGRYEVRGRCSLPDGSRVVSNVVRIDVRRPVTRADKDVAALAFGEQQGTLMSLVGSDAPQLRDGNDALRTIAERYPRHPMATVARIVLATNAAREFKSIGRDGSVDVRQPQIRQAMTILRGATGLDQPLALQQPTIRIRGSEQPLQRLVAALLTQSPAGRDAAHAVTPFIRSRVTEIAAVTAPRVVIA